MTATNPAVVGEREAFEAWFASLTGFLPGDLERWSKPDDDDYKSSGTQAAWLGWQARAARAPLRDATPDQKESGESKKNQKNSGPEVRGGYSARGGDTVHALHPHSDRALCGVLAFPAGGSFNADSAFACKRCAKSVGL